MINEGKTWFSIPTQVKVEDPDNENDFLYGIAYHDVFICACCGGVFELEEINEDGLAIEPFFDFWADFTESIK